MGLLLFRVGAGLSLIGAGIGLFSKPLAEPTAIATDLVATAGGIFLLAGLWTPVAGAISALDQLWSTLSLYSAQREAQWIHMLLMLMAAGLAMLGPGAWSIDARLYGRKRFDVGSRGMNHPSK